MTSAATPRRGLVVARLILLVLVTIALVSAPFVIWGDAYALPWLEAHSHRSVMLTIISVVLLTADSVAPVPSTLVLLVLAANAGTVAGIIGGTLGLTGGVITGAWLGRFAVGRIAPRFLPERELTLLRDGLQRNLALTLACWRSVPVLAETSVILAASAGVPLRRILKVTFLPNVIIAVIYSVAADDSAKTAALTFFATLVLSLALWLVLGRRKPATPGQST